MPLFAALTRLFADLDALRPLTPEQEQRVLQKFRLDWNYHSNAIEGNSLTLGETRPRPSKEGLRRRKRASGGREDVSEERYFRLATYLSFSVT